MGVSSCTSCRGHSWSMGNYSRVKTIGDGYIRGMLVLVHSGYKKPSFPFFCTFSDTQISIFCLFTVALFVPFTNIDSDLS